jgi:hypothetical protein
MPATYGSTINNPLPLAKVSGDYDSTKAVSNIILLAASKVKNGGNIMKINIERLIGVVQEHFDNEQSYRLECKKKDWFMRTQKEKDAVNWHERNQHGASNEVSDICAILNISIDNLYAIARLARKWEKKHNWQYCFPAESHQEAILKYLTPAEPFSGPYINYINWNINHKAEKKAA